MVEITKDNFEQEVLGSELPVVLYFWADWSGSCRQQFPIMRELEAEYAGRIKFCGVNVDDQVTIALNYGITGVPTTVFMKYGIFRQRLFNVQTKNDVDEAIQSLIDAE